VGALHRLQHLVFVEAAIGVAVHRVEQQRMPADAPRSPAIAIRPIA
jgi:hypothetical protein